MVQFGASLTDNTRSVNYDHNTFITQATVVHELALQLQSILFHKLIFNAITSYPAFKGACLEE